MKTSTDKIRPENLERIKEIRKQIEDGTYNVDADKIADAIVTEAYLDWEIVNGTTTDNKKCL